MQTLLAPLPTPLLHLRSNESRAGGGNDPQASSEAEVTFDRNYDLTRPSPSRPAPCFTLADSHLKLATMMMVLVEEHSASALPRTSPSAPSSGADYTQCIHKSGGAADIPDIDDDSFVPRS